MEVFYYAPRSRGSRKGRLMGAERTPAPMANTASDAPCSLPPTVAARAEPLLAALREEHFETPCHALAENELAMEPDAHLVLRHASGYAAALLSIRWGEIPTLTFLSLVHQGQREELLITPDRRIHRTALPDLTRQSPPAWPWPSRDPAALWELHKRALASLRSTAPQPLPTGEALLALCDGFRLARHRRDIATRRLRPLRREEFLTAREQIRQAREVVRRMQATGSRHALLYTRLRDELAQSEQRSRRSPRGIMVLLAVAAGMVLLGASPALFGWALPGGVLHLAARWGVHRVSRQPPEETAPLAALAGPLLLGIAAALTTWQGGTAPPQALLFTLAAAILLLPLPGLDGGEVIDHLLYRRGTWIRPAIFVLFGAALGFRAWQADSLFLAWIGGTIALAPLLSRESPLLARRLRREIDWQDDSLDPTPEAVSALIETLEKRHPLSLSRLAGIYQSIHRRPTRIAVAIACLLLYGAALLLPLYPALRWLKESPALNRIASAAPGNRGKEARLSVPASDQAAGRPASL